VESIKVESNCSGRLDKILSNSLNISRNQIEKLIKEGLVKVNKKTILKPSFKLSGGEEINFEFKEAKKEEFLDIDLKIETLYEDEDVLVLNKPPNLVVHPAPSYSEPTLVDWLRKNNFRLSTISGQERNGIVHRLDKDTSGAIIVAKNNFAHQKLSEQLQDKSLGRYYLAVINMPLKDNLIINKPIARNPKNRLKMAVVEGGKEAKTAFAKLKENKTELIAAKLFSGRTHQIRVHLNSINRYILGDNLYGFKDDKYKNRILLHAYLLYFKHPRSKKLIEVQAPLFSDMQEYLKKQYGKEIENEINKEYIKNSFNFISEL
jgi:23S rRNA pseudouridine1911/1915/1917 synthase